MGISEWLQEINKDLDAANEKLIRKIYQNDPVKLQEALDKHRRRSAALSAAPPEIDISLMTDAELEDLREHIKLEIEHLEQQAVKFKNMMDQTKQRQSQYSSGQGGFWSLLGSALTDAIGNAGLIEEAILEKKKLLVRVENKLKKPAPTPQPQLQPNPAAERRKLIAEIALLDQEEEDMVKLFPKQEPDIRKMYGKKKDELRKKI